jgi:holliday junction DNA helicase RuvA
VAAMIGRLTGKVVAQEEGGVVVVDVNGVGYELSIPLGTVGRLTEDAEGRGTFFVHTHVREDTFALFGFASEADRAAFRALIGVSNVGPKTAVAILSALPAEELGRVVARGELARLTAISGVGKKTAERLLLELRDKLPSSETAAAAPRGVPARGSSPETMVVLSALTGMGYRPAEAERAIAALAKKTPGAPVPELIREALAILAK